MSPAPGSAVPRMADRIRHFDWASTPLGAIDRWPQSLKTAVDILLGSGHAMQLAWGPERTVLYNDAYAPMLGDRHPGALGLPFRDAWPDIWSEIEPLVERVFAGETVRYEDLPLVMTRHGYPEDTWWNFSYSPVRDESGSVAGLLNVTVDATPNVQAQRAEQALRASEQRLRHVLDGMDEAFGLMDRDFRIVTQNATALRLDGRSLDEIRGRTHWEVYPGSEDSELGRLYKRALAEQVPVSLEHRYEWPHGVSTWLDMRAYPVPEGLAVFWRDISARKAAEEALRESEERRSLALEATQVGTFVWHVQEDRGEPDARMLALFDQPPDGTLTLRDAIASMIHPDDAQRYADAVAEASRPDGSRELREDIRVRRGDDWRWVAVTARVAFDHSGRPLRMAGTGLDITERKRAEIALRESEERFRSVSESGVMAIAFFDTAGAITEANDAFLELVGHTREELEAGDVRWDRLTPPEWMPKTLEAVRQYERTGRIEPYEKEYFRKSGERFWGLFGGRRIESSGEGVAFVLDITERKRAEATLRGSEERQALLLKLSDAARSASDERQILREASRLVGQHFGCSAHYAEVVQEHGVDHYLVRFSYTEPSRTSFDGRYPVASFPGATDQLYKGRTVAAADVATDPRLSDEDKTTYASANVGSFVMAPLLRNGRLLAVFAAHGPHPHAYSDADARLVEEVAERTWAAIERVRAEELLRESEERLRQFGQASQDVLWIRDAETMQWQYLTPAFEEIYGLTREQALSGNNYRSWMDLVVPEDRAAVSENIARVRSGARATFDYRIRRPIDGRIRWLRNTDFPIVDASGKVALIGGIGHDLTELREAERRMETLVEGIPQLVWRAVDGGHWTWASPQWTKYTGLSEAQSVGYGWLAALHPDDRENARREWAHAIEKGGFEVEYRVRHADQHEYRWFQTRATPVLDDAGAIVEWLGTSTDIHELRELQQRQTVLVGELQHRTRNLMSVVLALADRADKASADNDEFRSRFRDRLNALARVQALLSRLEKSDRITFDQLLRAELAAMDGGADRVFLDGPSGIRLRSSTVQTLALALHELATNAVKYGALAQPHGRLDIAWRLMSADRRGRPRLQISWRESGVTMPPPGSPSSGSGQGRELIEEALPYQLGAETTFELGPDGVHCTIAIPVSASNVVAAASP